MSGEWTILRQGARPIPHPAHRSGRYYGGSLSYAAMTALPVTQDILYAVPILIPDPVTYTVIGVEVTGFVAGNVRIGVYTDNNGVPSARMVDSGAISTGTANGFKSAAISVALVAGWYWLAGVFSAAPTVRMHNTGGSSGGQMGWTSGTDTGGHVGWSVAFTYAALPDPFTGGGALMTTAAPRFLIGF